LLPKELDLDEILDGIFTLPGGSTIPPGLTLPPNFTLPPDFTLPPGYTIPPNFTVFDIPSWPERFDRVDSTYNVAEIYLGFNAAWAVTCFIALGKWKERALEYSC
jgi:hypothetical protein